jgi:saccharopine dehydrogenase (NAD+, L-lysine-forming)
VTVVLLGAAGIIGRRIARDLLAAGISPVRLADFNAPAVEALGRELGLPAAAVDVTDVAATRALLRAGDLALNATVYYHNLSVMDACLAAGADYLDLGGLYHTTRRQLAWGPKFARAGLLAVLGCGKAPGLSNVLAARGASGFDSLETVRLRSGRRALADDGAFQLPYSPATLLDEFTLSPVVLTDGQLAERPALEQVETVEHPPPIGPVEYTVTLHSELATLPEFLGRGVREMSFAVGLTPGTVSALRTLVRLGFASTEPITVGPAVRVRPRDVSVAVLGRAPPASAAERWLVEAELRGRRDGRRLVRRLGLRGTQHENGTSIGAVAGAKILLDGPERTPGVLAPESVFDPERFLEEVRRLGLEFRTDETADGGGP